MVWKNKDKERLLSSKNYAKKLQRKSDSGKPKKKLDKNSDVTSYDTRRRNGRPSWALLDTQASEIDEEEEMPDSDVEDLLAMVDDRDDDDHEDDNVEKNHENDQNEKMDDNALLLRMEQKHLLNQRTKTTLNINNSKPILSVSGEPEGRGNDDDKDDDLEDSEPDVDPELSTPKSFVEAFVRRESSMEKLKEQLALISNSVMTYPELNISKLKNIFAILDTSVADPEYGVVFFSAQKLAIQSLCVVFNDIIPNYRVSERIKSDEMAVAGNNRQLKRETIRSLEYEKYLLGYYQLYLQRLQRILAVKQSNSDFYDVMLSTRQARTRLASVACQCLCEMLVYHYNFNNRSQLIEMLALLLCNANRGTEQMRQICFKTFVRLFKVDTLGEASLESVKIIASLVVKYEYRVKPIVFETFLHLNLRELSLSEEESGVQRKHNGKHSRNQGAGKKDRKQMSRKERKRGKHMGKLQKELLETEAEEDYEKRHQHKTKIHTELFALYFRFLRHIAEQSSSSLGESWNADFERHYRGLFGPLLQGIANYSVYLNDNYIYSLIDTIRELIQPRSTMEPLITTPHERLCCLRTIFQILTFSGNLVTIDFEKLYRILYEICADQQAFLHSFPVLSDCFEEMFFKRFKQIPLRRVNSFLNRLVLMASHLCEAPAIALLSIVRRMLQLNPSNAAYLLDPSYSDEICFETNITAQSLEELPLDPDTDPSFQANSFQQNLHRLANHHYDLYVRYFAMVTLSNTPLASFDQTLKKAKQSSLVGLNDDLCSQFSKCRQISEQLQLGQSSQMTMARFGFEPPKSSSEEKSNKGEERTSGGNKFRHRPQRSNTRQGPNRRGRPRK